MSCNNEGLESEVDFTSISKSKLKALLNSSEEVRNAIEKRIKGNLENLVERKVDTPNPIPNDGCAAEKIQSNAIQTHSNSIVNTIENFNNESRTFRDDILLSGETGVAYKDTYYYLGTYLNNDEISFSDVQNFINILPTVRNIYNRLKDNDYNRVVISVQEKKDIIEFIDYIAPKIQNNNTINTQLINAVKEDLNVLTNRNSSQILEFAAQ